MVVVLNECWEGAGNTMVPQGFSKDGDRPEPPNFNALKRFQDAFHRLATEGVGAQRGHRDDRPGIWTLEEIDGFSWDDLSTEWISRGDWSIRMWVSDLVISKHAAADSPRHWLRVALRSHCFGMRFGVPFWGLSLLFYASIGVDLPSKCTMIVL